MDLLRARPVSREPDDGMSAVYECQACLSTAYRMVDAFNIPDHVRCSVCGYYEGDENAHD